MCGICNGDGNLWDYWIIIVDESKEHINNIHSQITELFTRKGIMLKVKGAWMVKINLLWEARLFNFLKDQSIDEPKYNSLK